MSDKVKLKKWAALLEGMWRLTFGRAIKMGCVQFASAPSAAALLTSTPQIVEQGHTTPSPAIYRHRRRHLRRSTLKNIRLPLVVDVVNRSRNLTHTIQILVPNYCNTKYRMLSSKTIHIALH